MNKRKKHLLFDVALFFIGIAAAYAAAKYGAVAAFVALLDGYKLVAAFIAGLLFTSVLTTAIGIVIFVKLGATMPLLAVALVGGLGAMAIDYVMFWFTRDRIMADYEYMLANASGRIRALFTLCKQCLLRRLLPIIGAFIIMSPFPDELGVALMGFSNISIRKFLALTYVMNAAGILVVVLLGDSLF
ncbi:MAG TPA: hypothetical protein VFS75_03205 [Candidatus Paceibacterota bacterium]|nr:hypothetical protein [Candidatus Paceibacterota bacterium]